MCSRLAVCGAARFSPPKVKPDARSAQELGPLPGGGTRASSRCEKPFGLGRRYSLGGNKRYQAVYRRGKSFPGRHMSLVYQKGSRLRVGFAASAKVGNSVVRHRVRRRMTEDFRMLRSQLPPGSYVFAARPSAAKADWRAMAGEMRALLVRAGLLS